MGPPRRDSSRGMWGRLVQDEADMEMEAQRLLDEQREADQKEKDEFEDRLKNRDLAQTKQVRRRVRCCCCVVVCRDYHVT